MQNPKKCKNAKNATKLGVWTSLGAHNVKKSEFYGNFQRHFSNNLIC